MQPVITKTQFDAAQRNLSRLQPLADALVSVDAQALNHNAAAIEKFADFADFVALKIDETEVVVKQAHRQYADRDQEMISAALARINAIDNDVIVFKKTQAGIAKNAENKILELKKQGFSESEIKNIVDDPTYEINDLEKKIEALAVEKKKCLEFINDCPAYRESFLENTSVSELRDALQAIRTMVVK